MAKEIWKKIPGFNRYQVSNKQRVRLTKKRLFIFNRYIKQIRSVRSNYVILKSESYPKTRFRVVKKVSVLFDKAFNS